MKCYRIYTENKSAKWIERLLSIGFDGFTVIKKAMGFWKDARQDALEIVIYTDNGVLIKAMADAIKRHNKQETILIAETECRIEMA